MLCKKKLNTLKPLCDKRILITPHVFDVLGVTVLTSSVCVCVSVRPSNFPSQMDGHTDMNYHLLFHSLINTIPKEVWTGPTPSVLEIQSCFDVTNDLFWSSFGRYFPFDQQSCSIVIGAWIYNSNKMNVTNVSSKMTVDNFTVNGGKPSLYLTFLIKTRPPSIKHYSYPHSLCISYWNDMRKMGCNL